MSSIPRQADPELVGLLDEVLREHRPGPDHDVSGLDRTRWNLLEGLGLTLLTSAETRGGSGGSWHDAAALHEGTAAHGIHLPLAEHDLLASWALESASLPPLPGIATVALLDGSGEARTVPWASQAEHIVLIHSEAHHGPSVEAVLPGEVEIETGTNLAGLPRDTVRAGAPGPTAVAVSTDVVAALRHRAALVRAIQMCGAMDAAVAATVRHVGERVQFGRSLAQFQAVQHRLADAAAEAALARAATWAALDEAVETDFTGEGLPVSIAVARSCAGQAGSAVVRAAHQLHGAIGTTWEHSLRQLTMPILAWTNEYGTVAESEDTVTRAVLATGGHVWPLVTQS
ncbi:acyl-CoA dehydrogenase family protein [Arsenicicoccus bolidensis]|uniref:acyl-CoA dehydrogenase family protein n=1 Tax=Arsenicicoccus bolidensis TaxID=229480 RepID=UPI0028B100A8|nr:acyl-CoA dehydrogenase family protein [Arsenicicoccus bolidensis]